MSDRLMLMYDVRKAESMLRARATLDDLTDREREMLRRAAEAAAAARLEVETELGARSGK